MSEVCYGHSGPYPVVLPNYGPCNPQAGISLCCEIGQTCLSNGLCVTQSGVYYNGGCTDSTYTAAICPTFCTSGDANWVVQCHGSAVKDGDFCCSVNGTTSTCCDTASNGLGLVPAISSAQAVSATSVGAKKLPTSITSDSLTSTPTSTASLTSTSLPTATSQVHASRESPPIRKSIREGAIAGGILGTVVFFIFFAWCLKKSHGRRRTEPPAVELNDLREGSHNHGPQAQPEGVVPTEVEGSAVGPVEMDADPTHAAPTSPPPYGTAAADVAPDNNPLRGPPATPRSWYDPNLGKL